MTNRHLDPALATSFEERRRRIVDFFADRSTNGSDRPPPSIEIACSLHRGDDRREIETAVDSLITEPHGDMFWMVQMVLLHYLGRRALSSSTLDRMRDQWRTYTPYRGDTENHWLMYYASMHLMCSLYPEDAGASWFNGRSSTENVRESDEYIRHWVRRTLTEGQGEWDSPHYLAFYLSPLALLLWFSPDRGMQSVAERMIDLLVADFAAESLNGLYGGAHSRIYPEPCLDRRRNPSTTISWLLFGNAPFAPDPINVILPRIGYRPHGTAAILAMSGYTPDDILHGIATDRTVAYAHRERKRSRDRIRNAKVKSKRVAKYSYVCNDYIVGSIDGGLVQPVQQHSWEVLWSPYDPMVGRNVLFTLHPYSAPDEMAMYFPEEPKLMTERVISAEKPTYDSPDKWTGGSPYEQIVQHDDALIILYEIPTGTRFPHISGFFSARLEDLIEHENGWILMGANRALIAYYPLAPYEWRIEKDGSRRLHSDNSRNGAVVQVAPAADFADMNEFAEAIDDLPLTVHTGTEHCVEFTTLRGRSLSSTFGKSPAIDGRVVDYTEWPLFDGPFVQASPGTGTVILRHGDARRTLDFSDVMAPTDDV